MRFLFIDRILELEKGRYATGIKNVSLSDEYLVNIVPGFPVMPRSLLTEAVSQLVSWLVIFSKDFTVKPVAVIIEHQSFFGNVRPGDQMLIKAEIKSINDGDALCSGSVEVEGKQMAMIDNGICSFVPLEELEDISVVKDKALSLVGNKELQEFLESSELGLAEHRSFNSDNNFTLGLIDKIVDMEIGKHARGVKNFTMTEDFAVDHFPRKRVMPGTMIVESFVQLSEKLLSETIKAKTGSMVKVLMKENRRVKFKQFVKPGDRLILDINLINLSTDNALIKAKATVEKKVVFSAQIEFEIINLSK